jgi:putative transposase
MTTHRDPIYAGYRYPAEIISYAVWLYFRFPLSLRMVEEILAARGISVTYETIRRRGLKFGREFANRIRRRAPQRATSGTWMRSSSPSPARMSTPERNCIGWPE